MRSIARLRPQRKYSSKSFRDFLINERQRSSGLQQTRAFQACYPQNARESSQRRVLRSSGNVFYTFTGDEPTVPDELKSKSQDYIILPDTLVPDVSETDQQASASGHDALGILEEWTLKDQKETSRETFVEDINALCSSHLPSVDSKGFDGLTNKLVKGYTKEQLRSYIDVRLANTDLNESYEQSFQLEHIKLVQPWKNSDVEHEEKRLKMEQRIQKSVTKIISIKEDTKPMRRLEVLFDNKTRPLNSSEAVYFILTRIWRLEVRNGDALGDASISVDTTKLRLLEELDPDFFESLKYQYRCRFAIESTDNDTLINISASDSATDVILRHLDKCFASIHHYSLDIDDLQKMNRPEAVKAVFTQSYVDKAAESTKMSVHLTEDEKKIHIYFQESDILKAQDALRFLISSILTWDLRHVIPVKGPLSWHEDAFYVPESLTSSVVQDVKTNLRLVTPKRQMIDESRPIPSDPKNEQDMLNLAKSVEKSFKKVTLQRTPPVLISGSDDKAYWNSDLIHAWSATPGLLLKHSTDGNEGIGNTKTPSPLESLQPLMFSPSPAVSDSIKHLNFKGKPRHLALMTLVASPKDRTKRGLPGPAPQIEVVLEIKGSRISHSIRSKTVTATIDEQTSGLQLPHLNTDILFRKRSYVQLRNPHLSNEIARILEQCKISAAKTGTLETPNDVELSIPTWMTSAPKRRARKQLSGASGSVITTKYSIASIQYCKIINFEYGGSTNRYTEKQEGQMSDKEVEIRLIRPKQAALEGQHEGDVGVTDDPEGPDDTNGSLQPFHLFFENAYNFAAKA